MLSLRADARTLRTAIRGLQTRAGPRAVEALLRASVGDLAQGASEGVRGATGLERRVDTGRLVAAYNRIAQMADGRSIGPTTGSGEKNNPSRPGDAVFTLYGRGLSANVALQNGVPYAGYIENGTAKVPAGYHLARATLAVTRSMPARVEKALRAAWVA